jgi:hypothetical protein
MKGIGFKEPLSLKVIHGEKEMTRRIIKPQPDDSGVRCERLQDISDEDCIKEGISAISQKYNAPFIYYNGFDYDNTPSRSYATLINKICGKGTWESNPYVWVYDFKLLKK